MNTKRLTTTLKLILLASVLMVVLVAPAATPTTAQDDDAERGRITNVRAISVLPAGIRFWILLDAPHEEIANIDIVMTQDDMPVVETSLSLDDSILFGYEDAIEYEFFLDLSVYTDVQPFEQLVYRIDAVSTSGLESTMDGVTAVEHQGIGDWQTSRAASGFTLYWANPTLNGRQLTSEFFPIYQLLAPYFETFTPIKVALYAPFEPFCRIVENEDGDEESVVISERRNFPCSIELTEAMYAERGIRMVQLPQIGYQYVLDELVQIIVAQQFNELWGDAEIPAWFREGLGRFFVPLGQPEALRLAQRASQTGHLLRLSQLNREPDENIDAELWAAEAYLFTLYIADQYGANAPLELAALIDEETSFNAAFRQIADTDIETAFAAWVIWIDTSRAAQAAEWNPYQADTPTPTLTFTPSPIPPTRTLAPTATITSTPTQRPLFVATNPPTLTLAPPTARPSQTNTALPAGFFDQATATPAQEESSSNDSLCGAGIGTVIFPVMGLLAAAWQRKSIKGSVR